MWAFTPRKTADAEARIAQIARNAIREPIRVAIALHATFYMEVPKSAPSALRKRTSDITHAVPHTKRPDGDNLLKTVMDALNSIAYVDDAQIWHFEVTKRYSLDPRTEITLSFESPS